MVAGTEVELSNAHHVVSGSHAGGVKGALGASGWRCVAAVSAYYTALVRPCHDKSM